MIYNEKYKRFIDDDYIIYRMNKEGKLVQVKPSINNCGYPFFCYGIRKIICVHRFVWETLKGQVPKGYEIDHINTIKTDNRVENLRCVTHTENMNNLLTVKKRCEIMKGRKVSEETRIKISKANKNNKAAKGKPYSEFGKKFKEHFGITKYQNKKLYFKEHKWYRDHNKKCRWE